MKVKVLFPRFLFLKNEKGPRRFCPTALFRLIVFIKKP
ncbi:conserved hypothetical protein [delta proteobacterium NaphS2]|nr:conserved hypothetical protein [delta proteobacterium NaphS2]